mgnify:CR=1 FL=1
MPDLTVAGKSVKDPGIYDYSLVGTAAGTTTIMSEPCVLGGVVIATRVASGAITLYDSVGTSTNVIGTITLGTQTFSDPPMPFMMNLRTKTALTVVNSANQGALILYNK